MIQQGANDRKRISDEAEGSRVKAAADAENVVVRGHAKAETLRNLGEAEAATERSKVEAYAEAGDGVLLALAVKDVAGNLPDVGTLVLAPDLVTSLLTKFIAAEEPET